MANHVDLQVRRELRDGDADALVELHERLYAAEYGLDARFTGAVRSTIATTLKAGWMRNGGAVWLVDHPALADDAALAGSLALTDEGGGLGKVRWFVLAPELRGRGLGGSMITELLAEARRSGLTKLALETFSALTAAARIYRTAGFQLVSSEETDMWGPPIVLQRYELALDPSESSDEHERTGNL